MNTSDLFGNEDALTPELREQVRGIYSELEIALFEKERAEHLELCRTLAGTARQNCDEEKAKKIAAKFREWDDKHLKVFLKEMAGRRPVSAKEAAHV